MAKYLLLRGWLVFLKTSIRCGLPIFLKDNHPLESRMQEICQSGSEGGANTYLCPYPYLNGGGPFKPQTALLRRRPSVGVEPWIPLEWEKWSYIPEDWILSNRKSARVYLKRSSE